MWSLKREERGHRIKRKNTNKDRKKMTELRQRQIIQEEKERLRSKYKLKQKKQTKAKKAKIE